MFTPLFAERRTSSVSRSHRWCRLDTRAPNPASSSFALAGCRLLLNLRFELLRFGRVRIRSEEEFGGPPPFEPSLKVEGNIGHIKASGLVPRLIAASTLGVLQRSTAVDFP
jgi:hypothetical protein